MGTTKGWETRRQREQARANEWNDALLAAGKEEAAKVCDALAVEADADAELSDQNERHAVAQFYRTTAAAHRTAAAAIRKDAGLPAGRTGICPGCGADWSRFDCKPDCGGGSGTGPRLTADRAETGA